MYSKYIKRFIDFILSLIGFTLLFPVFALLYLIVLFINKGNPLFFQERPGKNEKVFKIVKFKTMTDERDSNGNLLPDEKRLTKLGNFMRKSSLDEIPQLINVIKGDMSLVGPRPLRTHYLPYYTERERLRHTVRPGITGLAQVSGRNAIGWDEKLEKDVEYVENLSMATDISILFKTVEKVFKASNVILDDTMQTFDEYRTTKK
ncbi:hypothetical protein DN53_14660 [Flagellimonas olearia]|uniref:Bacterial sugar transferase domain-containing protein n=1 Tax=Flagellimonas olearia TaxID=552546 RepID=A0A444VKX7_9FLAO|nr:sugar transferase [Allomuricauda olearia]RYC51435.1 hypothetical protein DN53_14660 [Allomuricauda olearia]